ncbi:GPR1/FUN34/yaaH family-domain-containing protein [Tricladium varicosporioides]|nr:GPR1/FUN34/yaaH family-domain-containing protein [Hymenoscyphus varicosporioides]
MSSADSVRNVVRRSSLKYVNQEIHPDLTNETVIKGGFSSSAGKPYPFFVPSTVRSTLGTPTALAIGAFATTLTTLSFSLMEWRGVTTTNVYIGNFFFVAGVGMVISAQWELVLGFFYGGFGAIITPIFGVTESYGTDTAEHNNALGFFVLMWAVLNIFFLFGSLPINLVYIGIFFFVELTFSLVAGSYFATADGNLKIAEALRKTGGVFAFLAGLLGYYTVAHLMCQTAFFWGFPMGDTSRFFIKRKIYEERGGSDEEEGKRT